MFVTDFYTLQTVYTLYFLDHVVLNASQAFDLQDIMRVHATFCDFITGFNYVAVINFDSGTIRDQVILCFASFHVCDDYFTFFLCIIQSYFTAELCDDCQTFRFSSFKQFFNSRKTLCDVIAGDTASMECTHCQLCTGFTDGLSRDDTYGFTDTYISAGSHVRTVTFCTDTNFGTACQYSSDPYFFHACFFYCFSLIYCDHCVLRNDDFACFRVNDVISRPSAADTILQAFDYFVTIHECGDFHTRCIDISAVAAIPFSYDDILGYVYQTTCQVTGVGCLQRCISQTFTSTVSGNEVFQYGQTFTEVRFDGQFDDTAVRGSHQTTHTSQLFDLSVGTTGTGVSHHVDVVVFTQTSQQSCCDLIIGDVPCFDYFLVTFFVCHQTTTEFSCDHINFCFRFFQIFCLSLRNFHIGYGYCHSRSCGEFVTQGFDLIQYICCLSCAAAVDTFIDNFTDCFFVNQEVNFIVEFCFIICSVNVAQDLRDRFVEDDTTNCCFYHSGFYNAVEFHCSSYIDDFVQCYFTVIVSQDCFFFIFELFDDDVACFSDHVAFCIQYISFVSVIQVISFQCQVVHTQDHILRGYCYRSTVGGFQQVVRRQQQETAFCLCFHAQRYVNRHLVTVEVGVVRCTYQRMQFDRTAFYQNGFKCLNTQSVQCRRTVQHNRMFSDNFFQNIPYFCLQSFYHSLSGFDVVCQTIFHQFLHYEGFEQFDRHFFRQTALVNFQFRTYYDYRTAGVVNTFTQQVLTETTLFTFQHIGQRFQCSVTGACYRSAAAAVVDQCVNCFLQHSFFVSYDDVGSAQIQQSFQTVVSVDNSSVQIVQVTCCKSAAIQLNHRTDFRRNNGDSIQDHPFGFVTGQTEAFDYFQLFDDTNTFLTCCILQLCFQFNRFFFQIDIHQQLFDCFCAHCSFESIAPFVICFSVFSFCQQLFVLQICFTGVQYDIGSEVQNLFQSSGAHGKDQTHSGRDTFEVPDMGNGSSQFNVAHSLTSYFCFCYFNAAAVADNAFVTDSFIFTTMTFPVFCGPENSFAEQTVLFRFQCSIVDSLRFFNFTSGPFTDFFGRCQTDLDGIEYDTLFSSLCAHGLVSFLIHSHSRHLRQRSHRSAGRCCRELCLLRHQT